jgi:hypothetical protein
MKILVIAPSGFHLGFLGCYGNDWIETPTLDRLAGEGVVFDNHFSDCPSAAGAWRAWRTGRYDFPRPGIQLPMFPPNSADLLSTLRGKGIPGWNVTTIPGAPSHSGGDQWEEFSIIQGRACPGMLTKEVMKFIRRMKSLDHGLIWVQPDFLIPPWDINASTSDYFSDQTEEGSYEDSSEASIEPLPNPNMGILDTSDETPIIRLQRTYAAAVTLLDSEIEELFDQLRQSDFYDQLVIIVTTDRGFPLGEHGLVGDSMPWLHEELVHIPLIVRLPNGVGEGGRIGALTQPVDLMATLLEAFALPSSVESHGSSLLPVIRGEQERIRDFAYSGLECSGVIEWSLRNREWSFLLPMEVGSEGSRPPLRDRQLFVKPDDRWEVNNVLQHHPEVAEHLEQILRAFVNAPIIQAHGQPSVGVP